MDKQELQKELKLKYKELTKYLQNKYGTPSKAYFCNEKCKSKSPITRTSEGLFCHHIQEIEKDNLSNSNIAPNYPWEYQQPHNLCYCNHLEHLLLHILINIERCKKYSSFVEDGIIHFFIPELNKIYQEKPIYTDPRSLWRNDTNKVIEENEEEYYQLLEFWIKNIKKYNPYLTLSMLKDIRTL